VRGYAAIIDYDAIGLPMTAFVSIKPIDPAALLSLLASLSKTPPTPAA